jgi:hypothetical protein
VGDVADDRNLQAFDPLPALANREDIQKPLGGMLVHPVTGIHYG